MRSPFVVAFVSTLAILAGASSARADEKTLVLEVPVALGALDSETCTADDAGHRLCVSTLEWQTMNCGDLLVASVRVDGPQGRTLPLRLGSPSCAAQPASSVFETAAGRLDVSWRSDSLHLELAAKE